MANVSSSSSPDEKSGLTVFRYGEFQIAGGGCSRAGGGDVPSPELRILLAVVGCVFLWLIASVVGAGVASAQQPPPDEVNRVARQLSCPTCTGINVADCPTETCAQWRAKIGEMMAEGKSEQEILDYFAARYGDHVLQVPPTRGFFLGVWAVPAVAIVVGLAVLIYLARGWAKPASAPAATPTQAEGVADDEYLRRVEKELTAWKE
jgi:cytochrome c-type biogenesis protein CcmH